MTLSDDFKRRLAIWTLAAAALGLAAGIAFGDRMVIFRPVGEAYTMILTSVVYPYLFSSRVGGLGKLGPSRAWRLFQSSWGVYVFLWLVTLAVVFVLAMAIPKAPPAVFVDAGATPPCRFADRTRGAGQHLRRARAELCSRHRGLRGRIRRRGSDDP